MLFISKGYEKLFPVLMQHSMIVYKGIEMKLHAH